MAVSSRTPEGQPNQCPICDSIFRIEPSSPFGDAPCPSCGTLLWFAKQGDDTLFFDSTTAQIKKTRIRQIIAEQLGVTTDMIPEDIQDLDITELGGDSLDIVELVMEIEHEFDM